MVGVLTWSANVGANAYLLPRLGSDTVAWLAGACLVLAGVYGLSPLAGACLRACRRPFGFLARYWSGDRPRRQGARIGVAYGVSCVGCCVPMLGVMAVVGMANVAVVIALGVVMAIMKVSVVGVRVAQGLSVALIIAGVAVGLGWLQLSPHVH
jgi:predicted metal-binding membrane protein